MTLVKYKVIRNGYMTLETRCVM